ncbi:PREDICTED: DDB1- and CUL4-associated factor 8-like isoform X1 [Nelumbo nucifera]|uniref:DDB1- and CUL4-associated factor 8-like isoform X1 n=1 Tax=Nelumbo nucifera TaxID=4432 RepID=A0A1U7ZK33_NELNU|nr:PREDICTED: DDB1- and CUL4-associated factor 8-like isoform X1 [Nelumbo nucifera]
MESLSKGSRGGFAELWRRQVGLSQPRSVERLIGGSEVLVKRIDLYGKLDGHEGCVNAVEFNSTGDFLVSGSDDTEVILWNWATRTKKLSYPSGHIDNIFQTRIMPFTDDRKIVTSAGDGQIRLGQILEDGWVDTKRLGKHQGRVYKLAIEPGSPHIFYSCGEDGFIQHFDLRSHSATKLFWCSSFTENKTPHTKIELNSIVIDPRNPNYFSIGGSDEYARVYDIRNYQWDASSNSDRPVNTFCPHHLIGYNGVHITGLAYSKKSELLVSYNDELVYLFQKNMGIGPDPPSVPAESLQKQEQPQVYIGHRNSQTVKGVSFFGPSDEYVLSGSDCGHIFIWKKKGGQLLRLMVGDRQVVNQLEPHPHFPVFATSGMEKNIKLWAPLANDPIPLPDNAEEIMEANRQGREDRSRITLNPDVIMHVLRLQRRQTLAYIERRYTRADQDSDGEDEGEAYIFGLSDGDSSEEGLNNRECNIS